MCKFWRSMCKFWRSCVKIGEIVEFLWNSWRSRRSTSLYSIYKIPQNICEKLFWRSRRSQKWGRDIDPSVILGNSWNFSTRLLALPSGRLFLEHPIYVSHQKRLADVFGSINRAPPHPEVQSPPSLQTVNMGQWWSDMNHYDNILETLSEEINSIESYRLTMQYMFADDIFNVGRIKVWFYVSQNVYKRLPFYERERCHELVLEWISVFERKCPDSCVEHMHITWEEFRRCNDVLNWNINMQVVLLWFSRSWDVDLNTCPA